MRETRLIETILLVGDAAEPSAEVARLLGRGGYRVVLAPHAQGSVVAARNLAPAAVVICLPLVGAFEERVLHVLRCYGADTPLLAVARGFRDVERSRLLAAGADAVLVLPGDPAPLLAQLDAVRRRRRGGRAWDVGNGPVPPAPAGELRAGEIVIHPATRTVRRAGHPVPLTRTEFDVLLCLARRMGRVVSRETLLAEVWRRRAASDARIVDRQVVALRRKLEPDPRRPQHLHTVVKRGYRLDSWPSAVAVGRPLELAGGARPAAAGAAPGGVTSGTAA